MPLIEDRQAVLTREAVGVLRVQGVCPEHADTAPVVRRFRERVRAEDRQSGRIPPSQFDTERPVVRIADVGSALEQAEFRKRRSVLNGSRPRHGLIREIDPSLQLVSFCSQEARFYRRVGVELPLCAQFVLIDVGCLAIDLIGQHEWSHHAQDSGRRIARIPAAEVERIAPGRDQVCRRRLDRQPAIQIAVLVEDDVADVLHEEPAGAATDDRLRCRAP